MGTTRKLIKWGSSNTLIISLPRKWIKQNNLTADQIVKIQQNQDGTITIIPQDLNLNNAELETIVKIKDPDDIENIRLRILTKYLDGWDVIKIESTNDFSSNIRKKIEMIIEPLMGLEILGVSCKTVLIKNVMSVETSNVFNLIKMISDLTLDLGKMLLAKLNDPSNIEEDLGELEWENIRKYNYRITREQRRALLHPAVLTKMDLTLQDIMDLSFYVDSIFKIAESLKFIVETIKKQGLPPDEFGVRKFFEIVLDIMRDSVDSFLFKNTTKSIDVIKKINTQKPHKREVENLVDRYESTGSAKHPTTLSFQVLLDFAEKIMDDCEDVCLAALRRAI